MAEATARELGRLSLLDALELTALIAQQTPARHRRAAGRWLQRYMGETAAPTLDDAGVAVISLSALGGPRHADALETLRGLVTAPPGP